MKLTEIVEHVLQRDGKWIVTNKNKTKVMGTHSTKKEALSQLAAIEINKHKE